MPTDTSLSEQSSTSYLSSRTSNTEDSNTQKPQKPKVEVKTLPPGMTYEEFQIFYLNSLKEKLESSSNSFQENGYTGVNRGSFLPRPPDKTVHQQPPPPPSPLKAFLLRQWRLILLQVQDPGFVVHIAMCIISLRMYNIAWRNIFYLTLLENVVRLIFFLVNQAGPQHLGEQNALHPSYAAIIVRWISTSFARQTATDRMNTSTAAFTHGSGAAAISTQKDYYPTGSRHEKDSEELQEKLGIGKEGHTPNLDNTAQNSSLFTKKDDVCLESTSKNKKEQSASPSSSFPSSSAHDTSAERPLSPLSRPLVLLYCIITCIEAFIRSLNIFFSIEDFKARLVADGILHFAE